MFVDFFFTDKIFIKNAKYLFNMISVDDIRLRVVARVDESQMLRSVREERLATMICVLHRDPFLNKIVTWVSKSKLAISKTITRSYLY